MTRVGVYLLVGDDVVISKAGKKTYGWGALSAVLLPAHRQQRPDFRVLDLKLYYRTRRYLHDPPAADFILRLGQRFTALGGIRAPIHFQNVA